MTVTIKTLDIYAAITREDVRNAGLKNNRY